MKIIDLNKNNIKLQEKLGVNKLSTFQGYLSVMKKINKDNNLNIDIYNKPFMNKYKKVIDYVNTLPNSQKQKYSYVINLFYSKLNNIDESPYSEFYKQLKGESVPQALIKTDFKQPKYTYNDLIKFNDKFEPITYQEFLLKQFLSIFIDSPYYRVSEILSLRYKREKDSKSNYILGKKVVLTDVKSENSVRTLAISENTKKLINKIKRKFDNQTYLFELEKEPTKFKTQDNFNKLINKFLPGIELHKFRDLAVESLFRNKTIDNDDIITLAKLLGHSPKTMLENYSKYLTLKPIRKNKVLFGGIDEIKEYDLSEEEKKGKQLKIKGKPCPNIYTLTEDDLPCKKGKTIFKTMKQVKAYRKMQRERRKLNITPKHKIDDLNKKEGFK